MSPFNLIIGLFAMLMVCSDYTNEISEMPLQHTEKVNQNKEGKIMNITQNTMMNHFLNLVISKDKKVLENAITAIDENWQEGYEIMLIESIYFSRNSDLILKLISLLEEKTDQKFGYDFNKWFHWLWNKDANYQDEYFEYKAKVHSLIDLKFRGYFEDRASETTIRLDEVRWGGVKQDGIPPLRQPKMITKNDANYLNDSDIVFGIEVNGDARAYPKRILAWHEMFVDNVGGINVAGVYCTLCGTVILYETEVNGVNHEIGTSGFLYRSNKLMYDKATQSLWSTLEGEPVIGPLVGKGIKLPYRSVVTTTWGEWKKRHPATQVLSLDTGFERDYGEGKAYNDYFSTDKLMFTVPNEDTSELKNKDEILSIRHASFPKENIAISSKFLKKNSIYETSIGNIELVVLTDKSGAHRVYQTNGLKLVNFQDEISVIDITGKIWNITENKLIAEDGSILPRFATHNAFWFGYKAAFPNVKLIK